jgi:hypothetical protein
MISPRDIVSINELTLKLKIVGQHDIKSIKTSQMKKTTTVLKVLIYIITSIIAHPTRLTDILTIMSVSTFKTAVILYICIIFWQYLYDEIYPKNIQ